MLDQLRPADIDLFYSRMKLGVRAKAKRPGTLRAFFRFVANREMLAENPVSPDLKPPVGANRASTKPRSPIRNCSASSPPAIA